MPFIYLANVLTIWSGGVTVGFSLYVNFRLSFLNETPDFVHVIVTGTSAAAAVRLVLERMTESFLVK